MKQNRSTLTITTLGTVAVAFDDVPCSDFGTQKALALLIYLACSGQPATREALAGMFWADVPESNARASLSVALSQLRKQLPGAVDANRDTVALARALQLRVDSERFVRRWRRWRERFPGPARSSEQAVAALAEVVGLYQGSFLDELQINGAAGFEEWVGMQRARLERIALDALEALVTAYLERGEYGRGVQHARRLLQIDPFRERSHLLLMTLLARDGQRSAAVAHYDACRRLLREELGVPPGQELQAFYERIAEPAPDYPLPARPAYTAGREAEGRQIGERLLSSSCRLLTVTGSGGTGKTHLALEVAWRVRDHFLNGVCFVSLASRKSSPDLVLAISAALGLESEDAERRQEQLLYYLHNKELLLVLDGFEQFLPAVGEVAALLAQAPDLHILVTSRQRLGLSAEWLVHLDGLAFPETLPDRAQTFEQLAREYGSVALLQHEVERLGIALLERPATAMAVARICRLLNGLPLGIQLAAGWLRLLPADEVALELTDNIGFLVAGPGESSHQRRTLLTLLTHLLDGLTAGERRVCLRLSVFAGSFSGRAAEYVADCDLPTLLRLVDKTLLRRAEEVPRFVLPRTLRQHLREELSRDTDELAAARDRHAAYYINYVSERGAALSGACTAHVLRELDEEQANVRQAWERAVVSRRREWLSEAAEGLAAYYRQRGLYPEGERTFGAAARGLAGVAGVEAVHARLIIWKAVFVAIQGRTESARALLGVSLSLLKESDEELCRDRAFAYLQLGRLLAVRDLAKAERLCARALDLYKAGRDGHGMGMALAEMAQMTLRQGIAEDALQYYASSLYYLDVAGDVCRSADVLSGWANALAARGRLAEAEKKARQAHAVYQQLDRRASQGRLLQQLGQLLMLRGRLEEAALLLEESLTLYEQLAYRRRLPRVHVARARVLAHLGEYAAAQEHLGAAHALAVEIGDEATRARALWLEGWIGIASARYEQAREDLLKSVAVFRQLGEQVELSHSLAALAGVEVYLGRLPIAEEYLYESLAIADAVHHVIPALAGLNAAALLLAAKGNAEGAVQCLTCATRFPVVARSKLVDDAIRPLVAEAAACLPSERLEAARRHGGALDLWAAVASIGEGLAVPAGERRVIGEVWAPASSTP